ncbi:hypothetical protein MLD38_012680 [Melastoma candidum]|uniref:Uncharacterized protein n=1 Tax=Melastoma candidum TaxID=119954 RepID=A0ACB9R8D9_9MYRT|nr:hypothetical protein MLD38_012680 [Melastoma candidum]
MGRSSPSTNKDLLQIYATYGLDQWQTLVFLLLHAIFFSLLSLLFLLYFHPICSSLSLLPSSLPRYAAGFAGSVTAISALCLFCAAGNMFYSGLALHHQMAQRMVNAVWDWSSVKNALDLGCGRGILLNTVAMQLKKSGSSGRVVGLAHCKQTAMSALRTAKIEGVQEYVTCREGDVRSLPFPDNYFDVVTSAVFVHTVGKAYGHRTVEAAAERMRVVGELVRVLKPGGIGIVWDLLHAQEYARKLQELRVEDVRVSEGVTAFMVSSHIVSFTKPVQPPAHGAASGGQEVRLDWRS